MQLRRIKPLNIGLRLSCAVLTLALETGLAPSEFQPVKPVLHFVVTVGAKVEKWLEEREKCARQQEVKE